MSNTTTSPSTPSPLTPRFEDSPIIKLIDRPIESMTQEELTAHIAELRQIQNTATMKAAQRRATTPSKSADHADLDAMFAETESNDDDPFADL